MQIINITDALSKPDEFKFDWKFDLVLDVNTVAPCGYFGDIDNYIMHAFKRDMITCIETLKANSVKIHLSNIMLLKYRTIIDKVLGEFVSHAFAYDNTFEYFNNNKIIIENFETGHYTCLNIMTDAVSTDDEHKVKELSGTIMSIADGDKICVDSFLEIIKYYHIEKMEVVRNPDYKKYVNVNFKMFKK